jgi:hypothetical protein
LNGTGIGEANVFRNFDNDKYKNLLGRVSQDIGEQFRIGGFGYWGKEEHQRIYIRVFGLCTFFKFNIDVWR